MSAHHSLANVAALFGEPSRAAILLALLDGRALPAGELARVAQLSAAATSLHLGRLTADGVLAVRSEGRHRYYRLASAEVAQALEALGAIATPPPPPRALSKQRAQLREARSCYDHLAGAHAVALASNLERQQLLGVVDERSYRVTSLGCDWFHRHFGIDVAALAGSKRPVARRCLDWTERRPHLAGALGALLLEGMLERRWLARVPASRCLRVTSRGAGELYKLGVVTHAPGVEKFSG